MDENGAVAAISADDFAALEGKVHQAVELIRREREARATAEDERAQAQQELASVREELRQEREATAAAQHELQALHGERDSTRRRVEHMLRSMDELLN